MWGARHIPHTVTQPRVLQSAPSASGETCPEETGPVVLQSSRERATRPTRQQVVLLSQGCFLSPSWAWKVVRVSDPVRAV